MSFSIRKVHKMFVNIDQFEAPNVDLSPVSIIELVFFLIVCKQVNIISVSILGNYIIYIL